MKVYDNRTVSSKPTLVDLFPGDCFEHEGEIYIRSVYSSDYTRAMNVRNGSIVFWTDNPIVTPLPTARIVIGKPGEIVIGEDK